MNKKIESLTDLRWITLVLDLQNIDNISEVHTICRRYDQEVIDIASFSYNIYCWTIKDLDVAEYIIEDLDDSDIKHRILRIEDIKMLNKYFFNIDCYPTFG